MNDAAVALAAAGVADLVFEASDGTLAPTFVRVAVQAAAGSLRLIRHYVEGGLVVVRVADRNELPYANIPVRVEGRSEEYRTDERGLAWIPASVGESLAVEIEGAPESRLLLKAVQ